MPSTIAKTAWPTADLYALQARQQINQQIRQYFAEQKLLEVETPLLSQARNSDREIHSFKVGQRSLHSSPEHAMKRLLCTGIGSIYQLAKVFREDEAGRLHNPEFTLLEWYRINWSDTQLMQEVATLTNLLLQHELPVHHLTYRDAFIQHTDIDPFTTPLKDIQATANNIAKQNLNLNLDDSLDLIMSVQIEPHLGQDSLLFLTDFPASQAAMAELKEVQGQTVAKRFELIFKGIELANGYQELTCYQQQSKRFETTNTPADKRLLHCMQHKGLPPCAGVAMGIDRLLMLKLNKKHIQEVLSFAWAQA